MDRIITMIIRQLTNRLIRTGIDKGVEAMSNRNRGQDPEAPLDPQDEKTRQKAGKESTRRAKQAVRLGRKISRF